MKIEEKKRFLINSLYFILISSIIFLAYKYLFSFLLPFVIAALIGYFVQKPSEKIAEKLKVKPRTIAPILALFIYILGASFLSALVYLFLSNSPDTIKWLVENLTFAADKATYLFAKYDDFTKNLPNEIGSMLRNLPNSLANGIVGYLSNFLSSIAAFATKNVPAFFFSVLITIMASVYFARDFKAVKGFAFSVIPKRFHKNILKIKNIMLANIFKMAKGYGVLFLITFSELLIGLLLSGTKKAVFLAFIISLVDALPVLGVGIILVPWAIFSIITGKVFFGIYLVFLYVIITVVRNICEPKVLSSRLGIPPLLSILIIFCGLKLFGFFGMLISFISLVIFIDYYREDNES